MGLMNLLRRLDRNAYFLCYECMGQMSAESEPDASKAIFYYTGPPEVSDGRSLFRCPRCQAVNTVSFQHLKDTNQESQLFGLEQIVKRNPRSLFEVGRPS